MRNLNYLPRLLHTILLLVLVGCASGANLTAYPNPTTVNPNSATVSIPPTVALTPTETIIPIDMPLPTEAISECPNMPASWQAIPPSEWYPANVTPPADTAGLRCVRRGAPCPKRITLPAEAGGLLSPEKITIALFCKYLESYKNPQAHIYQRITDYKVYNAVSYVWLQHWLKDGNVDFVVDLNYSVLPSTDEPSDWWAGNGEISKDEWIRNKQQVVGFFKHDEVYEMKLFGN